MLVVLDCWFWWSKHTVSSRLDLLGKPSSKYIPTYYFAKMMLENFQIPSISLIVQWPFQARRFNSDRVTLITRHWIDEGHKLSPWIVCLSMWSFTCRREHQSVKSSWRILDKDGPAVLRGQLWWTWKWLQAHVNGMWYIWMHSQNVTGHGPNGCADTWFPLQSQNGVDFEVGQTLVAFCTRSVRRFVFFITPNRWGTAEIWYDVHWNGRMQQ